jgi:hypothetical protein
MSVIVTDKTTDRGGTLMRYELLRDHCQSFASAAAWANDNFNLTGHGEPLHASQRGAKWVDTVGDAGHLLNNLSIMPGAGTGSLS